MRPDESAARIWTAFGLRCSVVLGPSSVNGYVHVPLDHPDHGKHYDDVDVRVHGGLTYGLDVDDGTWFGFDTAHAGDWIAFGHGFPDMPGRIWTVDDVARETELLARQLAARRIRAEHFGGD